MRPIHNGGGVAKLRRGPSEWAFGEAIGSRRVELGWSQERAADEIGIARPTYVGLEKGSRRNVSPDTVRKIAETLGLETMRLLALAKYADGDMLQTPETLTYNQSASIISAQDGAENMQPIPAVSFSGPRDIPIYRTRVAQGGEGIVLENVAVDWAPRPKGIERAVDAFAFRWIGESMQPAIRNGAVLFADPNLPCNVGDDVLLKLPDGRSVVRRLIALSESEVTVARYHPEAQTIAHRREAVEMSHILTINELVGVH